MKKKASIVLAQGAGFCREALASFLNESDDWSVVAQIDDTVDLIPAMLAHAPGLLILFADLSGRPDARLLRRTKEASPSSRVVLVLGSGTGGLLHHVITWGADGLVDQQDNLHYLTHALHTVLNNGAYLSPLLTQPLMQRLQHRDGVDLHETLSAREFDVMRRLCAGDRVRKIADALHLSIKTVSTHKSNLMGKLGVESLPDLVRYSLDHRLLPGRPALDA